MTCASLDVVTVGGILQVAPHGGTRRHEAPGSAVDLELYDKSKRVVVFYK
jgi:hypothetical protein